MRIKAESLRKLAVEGAGDGRKWMINKGKDQCWIKIRRRLQCDYPDNKHYYEHSPQQGRAIAWVIRGSTVLMFKLRNYWLARWKEAGSWETSIMNSFHSAASCARCGLKSFHTRLWRSLKHRFRLFLFLMSTLTNTRRWDFSISLRAPRSSSPRWQDVSHVLFSLARVLERE